MLGGNDEEEVTALDRHVAPGLRLWMLIALISGVLLIMVVLVCCFMKIRIPRTKREIELMSAKRRLRKQRGNLPAQDVSGEIRSQTIVMHSLNVPGGQLVPPTPSEGESVSCAESTEDEKSALSAAPSGNPDRVCKDT
uniref:Transmembrane inner ear n=1 Tax=Plectus sambesii TaxID=2011161 RepID=A0A914WKD0_9BILA